MSQVALSTDLAHASAKVKKAESILLAGLCQRMRKICSFLACEVFATFAQSFATFAVQDRELRQTRTTS